MIFFFATKKNVNIRRFKLSLPAKLLELSENTTKFSMESA